MQTNALILAISGNDTLRPLSIQIRPFANNVRDTKYHKQYTPRINTMPHWLLQPESQCTTPP